MAQLPLYTPSDPILTRWKAALDPVLAQPLNSSNLVQNVALINGTTVVNHGLGRKPQGWIISDANAAATIYRSAPFNSLTLSLTSNAAVTISLVVF